MRRRPEANELIDPVSRASARVPRPSGLGGDSGSGCIMVDVAVESGAAWVCRAQGRRLADVLLTADEEEELGQSQGDITNRPVLLEQTEDGSPCVLTVRCSPGSPAAIGRLLVVSEARTMELYGQTGEYCGTARGERDHGACSEDRGPFYRKQLILELPSAACEVKLLSLAGRSSVLVCRVVVGLRPSLQQQQPGPVRGPGIDMEQVQCLVDEMGTSLSPGAQNLMEMVHFQQKNQTGSLGGLLPLLMGSGAFSVLARGANTSPAAVSSQTQSAESTPPAGVTRTADEAPPTENGAAAGGSAPSSSSSSSSSSPDSQPSGVNTNSGQVSHGHLAEMMSHFLKGRRGRALTSGAELLPVLQSVCGQVTQLRLDDAAEKERKSGSWALDAAMERRLEEMERRLKEHVDRRLDALEEKLERALLSALHQGGGAAGGSVEQGGGGPIPLQPRSDSGGLNLSV